MQHADREGRQKLDNLLASPIPRDALRWRKPNSKGGSGFRAAMQSAS